MTALLLPLLLSCTDYTYTQLTGRDVFQQVRRTTVDVLLVVDDSCSMAEEQDKLADNFQSFIGAFEGVDVDWQIGVTTTDVTDDQAAGRLRGGDDEVILQTADGRVLDQVAWDRTWPVTPGVAMQLDPSVDHPTANDSADAWCPAPQPWAEGDLGSPGAWNPACDATATAAPLARPRAAPPAADTGIAAARAPQVGDLLFTELLVDPLATTDADGEWVELCSLADDTLLLDGLLLRDRGRNSLALPDGLELPPLSCLLVGRSADPDANGGLSPQVVATPGQLSLADPVTVLTPDLPDVAELFGEQVAVGTGGAGWELGLEAARLALSEPLRSGDNAGFLRDDAGLAIIFLSDEDDYSPERAADYLLAFGESKGQAAFRDPGLLTVSAVTGVDPPPYAGALACDSDDGAAEYGARYVALADWTGGAIESICDEDFSPIAAELGLVVSGLRTEFVLSQPADANTLSVASYASTDAASLIATYTQDADYQYLPERNSIRFEPHAWPPSEALVVVEYELLATSQTVRASQGGRGSP